MKSEAISVLLWMALAPTLAFGIFLGVEWGIRLGQSGAADSWRVDALQILLLFVATVGYIMFRLAYMRFKRANGLYATAPTRPG